MQTAIFHPIKIKFRLFNILVRVELFNIRVPIVFKVVFHTKNFFSYLTTYSNLEMTSYRTKYRVYFKKDLIRTKLLGISKTTIIDS